MRDPRDGPRCVLCGLILPPPPHWWQRWWLFAPPPFHDPEGPYGDLCWRGVLRWMGLPLDTPKP